MAEKGLKIPPIYSLRKLADLAHVDYSKLYHANAGTYNSLSDNDRTKLYNALHTEFEKAAHALGFTEDGRRIKKA